MELLKLTKKGLYCELGDFYIDPWDKVDTAIITHAHGDHARWGMKNYITVDENEFILRKRISDAQIKIYPYREKFKLGDVTVSFHPAGHILGSSQVRIEYNDWVWVFTGDFKRDEDLTCPPFEVVPGDVFISEATFSLPVYKWPSTKDEGAMEKSLLKTISGHVLTQVKLSYCFRSSLGKNSLFTSAWDCCFR
jgi:putative mRNA 3-end processing factor